jgi:hypothetical protein
MATLSGAIVFMPLTQTTTRNTPRHSVLRNYMARAGARPAYLGTPLKPKVNPEEIQTYIMYRGRNVSSPSCRTP